MRTALLDVNVLMALLWPAHEHFEAAHAWFAARGGAGRWATCPLTELAFVRIVSNPSFSAEALAPADALGVLQRNLAHPPHEFWADDLGLADALRPEGQSTSKISSFPVASHRLHWLFHIRVRQCPLCIPKMSWRNLGTEGSKFL